MGNIFDFLLVNPMTNALMLLYGALGNSYVLAIVALTLIIRLLTLPLTLRQQISAMKMSALQPQIKALQEKYKNDPQTLSQEMRKLGFNPLSGCLPLLIQFPILIAMYQAIIRTLAVTPLSLVELGSHTYSFLPGIASLVPINSTFLGIFDLGTPDRFFIIPILVVVTTYFANKLMTPPTTDPTMRQTNQMMQLMMPMMFGFFMLSTPVGLGIYWIVSNVAGVLQYYITKPALDRARAMHALPAVATADAQTAPGAAAPAKPLFEPPKAKVKVKAIGTVNRSAAVKKKGQPPRTGSPRS
ncbi:MAG: YidC/Oxa1 family membrane protein insertase [Thermoflexales bacterium]|nr:YidC/Oxa1 family membrane protein insertase [Thermoflexales bacterium]